MGIWWRRFWGWVTSWFRSKKPKSNPPSPVTNVRVVID